MRNPVVAATIAILALAIQPSAASCTVTFATYQALEHGMTYPEVVGVVGCEGETRIVIHGGHNPVVRYTWKGDHSGAIMIVTFVGPMQRLKTKTQFGLK